MFKCFYQERGTEFSETSDFIRQSDPAKARRDYSDQVRALHRALHTYKFCNDAEPSSSALTLKLRLNGYEEEDEYLKFSILFLPHPHSDDQLCPMEWQDTQISVSLSLNKRYAFFGAK
jgi:hypothetical protein